MHFSPFNSIGVNINRGLLGLGKVAKALAEEEGKQKTHSIPQVETDTYS